MEVLRSVSPPRGYDLEDPSSVMNTAYAMEPMDEESTNAATMIAAEHDEGGAAQINQQDAYATTQSSNVSEPTSHLKYAEACRAEEEMPNHAVEQDLVSLRQDVQKIALAEKKQERAKTVLKQAHFLSSVMREFQLIFDQVSICVAIAVKQLRSGNAEAQSNDYNHITRHVCCVLFVLGRLATLIGMSLCNAALAGGRNLCFLLERRLIHYGFDAISSAEELCPSTSVHSQWLIARGDLELHSVPFARDLSSNTCMYSGTWDSTAVMIKSVRRESAETRRAFLNELEIWSKLQHPHVVRLLGACDDDQSLFVCEMAKKTLSAHVYRKNEGEMWSKLYETALGLLYLHKKHGMVHGNIKCANILVGDDNKAKLINFVSTERSVFMAGNDGPISWHSAPEIAHKMDHTPFASDVYSLGMCIIEATMSRLQPGYAPGSALKRELLIKKALPLCPQNMKENQWSLVRKMCAWLPSARPDMTEVVNMLKQIVDEENHAINLLEAQRQIVRAVDRKPNEIPAWFIDEIDMDICTIPFNGGSFGSVHTGKLKGADVVVKRLLPQNIPTAKGMKSFMKEVNVWHNLNHPHVIRLYGACDTSRPPFYVCESAVLHGNLEDYLVLHDPGKKTVWRIFYEAALGIQYLHQQNIVHGDLKCNNILVGDDKKAKISDFGLSFIRSESKTMSKQELTGATPWVAPECLSAAVENPTKESDIYSLAMCIIQAFKDYSASPWGESHEVGIKKRVSEGHIPMRPMDIPDDAWALIQQMSANDPMNRISLDKIIQQLETFAIEELAKEDPTKLKCPNENCRQVNKKTCKFCSNCGRELNT